MRFESLYAHGFARVAACTADVYVADPARNAESVIEVSRRLSDVGRRGRGVPRARPDRLRGRRPARPGRPARRRARGPGRDRPGQRRAAAGDHRRRAAPAPGPAVQHRRRHPPRPGARGGPQDPPAQLPGVLRAPPVRLRPRHHRPGDHGRRAAGAVRHRPAVRRRRRAAADRRGGDLRGHVRPGAAVQRPGAGRGDGAGQPVRQPDHHRPRRHPQRALPYPVDALPVGVPVRRRRSGRVDHRPVLGRADQHLRERPPARPGRPLRGGSAAHHRRRRPRPAPPGARPAGHLRGQPPGGDAGRRATGPSSSPSTRPTATSACGGWSSASRSCPPIPTGSPRTATRRTTSRSTGSPSGCGRSPPTRW